MAPVRAALQRDKENHRRWWMGGGQGDDLQCCWSWGLMSDVPGHPV